MSPAMWANLKSQQKPMKLTIIQSKYELKLSQQASGACDTNQLPPDRLALNISQTAC